jgi:uncharacterized membrane protein YqjE
MAKSDDPTLSSLVQTSVNDVRELVQAEVALAKSELKTLGTSVLLALTAFTAAFVLVAIMLAMLAAWGVLVLDGKPTSALAAASGAIAVVTAIGVMVCVRMLPSRRILQEPADPRTGVA